MKQHRCRLLPFLILGLIGLLLTGCIRNLQAYSQFAQAGTTYATAMDSLLVAAQTTEVNADSEMLVNLSQLGPVSPAQYSELTLAENQTSSVILRLRKHTQLTGTYFAELYIVATSSAPQDASVAAQKVATDLNTLGVDLRTQGTPLNPQQLTAIGTIGQLAVATGIREIFRKALLRDNQTIRKELLTQQDLLAALSTQIQDDLRLENQYQTQRLILVPLANPKQLVTTTEQNTFVTNRLKLATAVTTAQEMETASGAAKKLQTAYESLLSGKVNLVEVNSLVADLNSLLNFAEAVRTLNGAPTK